MKTIAEQLDSPTGMETVLEPPEFSLLLGGTLFQLCRRTHLSGNTLEWLYRRVLATTLFAWLPLLFLSVIESTPLASPPKSHSCTTSRRTFDSCLRYQCSLLPSL
jgi:hypothetical protein